MTFDATTEKFETDTALKDILKISKGKITAGKQSGTAYIHAVFGYDKKSSDELLSACPVAVEIRQAPSVIQAISTPGKSEDGILTGNQLVMDTPMSSDNVIKSVTAPINNYTTVYCQGLYKNKDGKQLLADVDMSGYYVEVDPKSLPYIALTGGFRKPDETAYWAGDTAKEDFNAYQTAVNSALAAGNPIDVPITTSYFQSKIGLNSWELLNQGFYIAGINIAANDKPFKGSVTITSRVSGKKLNSACS